MTEEFDADEADFNLPTAPPTPTQNECLPQAQFEDSFDDVILPVDQSSQTVDLDQTDNLVFKNEIACCNVYLKNIHRSFKHATNTHTVIQLVDAALRVHRHRRATIEILKQSQPKPSTKTFDLMGNPI